MEERGASSRCVETWRSSRSSQVGAAVFVCFMVVFSIWSATAAVDDSDGPLGVLLALAFSAAVVAVGVLWVFRSKVELATDGLTIVGMITDRSYQWTEIEGAEAGYHGVAVFLSDGSFVLCRAVQKWNLSKWLSRDTRADALARQIARRAQESG